MILIIDCGSSKTPKIAETLSLLGVITNVVLMKDISENSFEKINGIIISGAPILLSKVDKSLYLKQFDFLNKTNLPVLGICFGHQIIGLLNGADVFLGEPVRIPINIDIIEDSELFNGIKNKCLFAEDHTEGITIPKGFKHLAKSDKYEVEAMKHPTKNIYGVQFHPEVSGENGKIVLQNFCNLCKQ